MRTKHWLVLGFLAIGLAATATVIGYLAFSKRPAPVVDPPDSTPSSAPNAADPPSATHTMPAAVIDAVKSMGGSHHITSGPKTNQPVHMLWLGTATDADLKKLPPVPLPFVLNLSSSKLTAAGLEEIKGMPNLVSLVIDGPQVTDDYFRVLRKNDQLHLWFNAKNKDRGRPASPTDVAQLDLKNTGVTDDGLKEFQGFANLNILHLPHRVSVAGLKQLKGWTKLTEIELGIEGAVTDEMLRTLGEIGLLHALWLCSGSSGKRPAAAGDVTRLRLTSTAVTSAGLQELRELKNLQQLDVPFIPLTTDGLRSLAGLKALNWLSIHPNQVTDEVLRTLREIGLLHAWNQAGGSGPNGRPTSPADVTAFSLWSTKVTDAAVAELKVFPNLTSLDLTITSLTADALKELKAFPSLRHVRLDPNAVTNDVLRNLNAAGRLHALWLGTTKGWHDRPKSPDEIVRLDLRQTAVSDAGLKEFQVFRNLTELDLSSLNVTDAGLKDLGGMKSLVRLELSGTPVTDAGLKELSGLRSLTYLGLGSTKVTGEGLKNLKGLDSLTLVNLSTDQVTDATLRSLREIGLLHALMGAQNAAAQQATSAEDVTRFYPASDHLTDAGLKELAAFPNLTALALSGSQITDAGLKELAGLKKLVSLELRGTKVTDAGVKELQQALPACQVRK
jgi:Leucine-rich repeat (LRR) protein